ncbi:MAG TPA: RNA-binding domain-containing protein [Nitrospirota bacterium]|nr:RNA-binding domain-containing protein [Nitrospirota bacterium]
MALPVNIYELLHGRVVESERLEFKEGWNPEAVLHTMCAFANDINNWGGGYIVIGVAEKENVPVFPPNGLSQSEIAKVQKELLGLSHKMRPEYFPVVEVTKFESRDILIIWVPGGNGRPYKSAVSLAKGAEYAYYIRRNSVTKLPTTAEERGLIKLANNIPFDDRINHNANLNDLNITLIQSYLMEIRSALSAEVSKLPFADLCLRMNIAQGPAEYLKPKNIGLLLFSDNPENFFPRARIDIVEFEDDVGDVFSEKIFIGPVHQQVRSALGYLKNAVIKEFVRKVPGRAEADRFYNYPYEALEEVLVNAVYHRSYEEREPVEVRVYPDRVLVLSYPGPLPPLGKDNINKPIVTYHRYRNSRLGDFLKELHLTEGRGTGFPKIRRALKRNGSPAPIFETDDDREYFMVMIRIHPGAKARVVEKVVEKVVERLTPNQKKIVETIVKDPDISAQALAEVIGISSRKIQDNIAKLKDMGLLKRVGPDKGGHWLVIRRDRKG